MVVNVRWSSIILKLRCVNCGCLISCLMLLSVVSVLFFGVLLIVFGIKNNMIKIFKSVSFVVS